MDSTAEIPAAPLPIIKYLRMLHLLPIEECRLEEVTAFKTQGTSSAARNAFTAG
jgi:hypothetical protein